MDRQWLVVVRDIDDGPEEQSTHATRIGALRAAADAVGEHGIAVVCRATLSSSEPGRVGITLERGAVLLVGRGLRLLRGSAEREG